MAGGKPVESKAGMVNNPPPPAIASIKPATVATPKSIAITSNPNSIGFPPNKPPFHRYELPPYQIHSRASAQFQLIFVL